MSMLIRQLSVCDVLFVRSRLHPVLYFVSRSYCYTQYDWLLASSCRPSACLSVRLSVTLCIVALRVGVQG